MDFCDFFELRLKKYKKLFNRKELPSEEEIITAGRELFKWPYWHFIALNKKDFPRLKPEEAENLEYVGLVSITTGDPFSPKYRDKTARQILTEKFKEKYDKKLDWEQHIVIAVPFGSIGAVPYVIFKLPNNNK